MRIGILSLLLARVMTAASGMQWPVELPLTLEKNLPLVRIKVNRSDLLTFIIDSAAAGCVLDRERAAAIGLTPGRSAQSSGSGGAQSVGVMTGVTLELGGIEIRPERCFAFDMKSLAFHGPVDGILGMPLFRKFVVEIDYPGARLRIFKPESFPPPARASMFPLRMTIGPVVRGIIQVRGREPIETDMQLDTGSAHVLTLCTPFVDRLNLLDAADELSDGKTLGFGGGAVDKVGRIEQVRLGPFTADRPVVRFSRQKTGTLSSEEHYSANLGGEFLRKYKVTFDIAGLRLFLDK